MIMQLHRINEEQFQLINLLPNYRGEQYRNISYIE